MSANKLILPELLDAQKKGMDENVLLQMQHETITYAMNNQVDGKRLNDYYVEVRSMNGGFMDFYTNAARAHYGQESDKAMTVLQEDEKKLQGISEMEFETDPYRVMTGNKEAKGLVDGMKGQIGKMAEALTVLTRFDMNHAKGLKDAFMKTVEASPWLRTAYNAYEAEKASLSQNYGGLSRGLSSSDGFARRLSPSMGR